MGDRDKHLCPVERAGSLDNKLRKCLQNPYKILGPYLREGMQVLDLGCGPGFFSIPIAEMVGPSGRVIAADVQEGMLQKVREKIKGIELEKRVTLHKCQDEKINLLEKVDFILLFYMVHEVPNQEVFFKEIETILKPDGQVYIVEPPFHVSKKDFEKMVQTAHNFSFVEKIRPKMLFNKAVILQKI